MTFNSAIMTQFFENGGLLPAKISHRNRRHLCVGQSCGNLCPVMSFIVWKHVMLSKLMPGSCMKILHKQNIDLLLVLNVATSWTLKSISRPSQHTRDKTKILLLTQCPAEADVPGPFLWQNLTDPAVILVTGVGIWSAAIAWKHFWPFSSLQFLEMLAFWHTKFQFWTRSPPLQQKNPGDIRWHHSHFGSIW